MFMLRCFWGSGEVAGHPMALRLAATKRGKQPRRQRRYSKLLEAAEAKVPVKISQQIKVEVRQALPALPRPAPQWNPGTEEVAELKLSRMLLAYEFTNAGTLASAAKEPEGWATSPGVTSMAAMCLGFTGGREEEAFWLLRHLIDEVLPPEYVIKSPAESACSSDRAVIASLIAAEAPLLTARLGPRALAEAVQLLSQQCLHWGFVGILADEPLLALWEELLAGRCGAYPRLPLVTWLAGLVQATEADLVTELREIAPDDFAQALCSRVCEVARVLPEGWRPLLRTPPDELHQLRRMAEEAWQEHLGAERHLQQMPSTWPLPTSPPETSVEKATTWPLGEAPVHVEMANSKAMKVKAPSKASSSRASTPTQSGACTPLSGVSTAASTPFPSVRLGYQEKVTSVLA